MLRTTGPDPSSPSCLGEGAPQAEKSEIWNHSQDRFKLGNSLLTWLQRRLLLSSDQPQSSLQHWAVSETAAQASLQLECYLLAQACMLLLVACPCGLSGGVFPLGSCDPPSQASPEMRLTRNPEAPPQNYKAPSLQTRKTLEPEIQHPQHQTMKPSSGNLQIFRRYPKA